MKPPRNLALFAPSIVGAAFIVASVAAFPGSLLAADVDAQSPASGTVPTGVCFADVAANGGSGYEANPGPVDALSGNPGFGASLTARFAVTAGEPYSITFADGGAAGPDLGVGNTGGAGGDAAAVAFSGVVHLAAGGGGGAGGISTIYLSERSFAGGTAGAYPSGNGLLAGTNGDLWFFPDSFRPNMGQGGFANGTRGLGHPEASPGQNGASAPGAIGNGGAGGAGDPGSVVTPSGPGGGGGGAGYNTGAGGGGGANNATGSSSFDGNFAGGGGGGNSFIDASAVSYTNGLVGYTTHTASASITWVACPVPTTSTTSTTMAPTTTMVPDTTPDTTPETTVLETTTTVMAEVAPTTTGVGSGAGAPRSLPTTGSTSTSLVLWSTILLLAGSVLVLRSKRLS